MVLRLGLEVAGGVLAGLAGGFLAAYLLGAAIDSDWGRELLDSAPAKSQQHALIAPPHP